MNPDNILAVVPENAGGPGWANTVLWIYWRDDNGVIQQESLQPNEQSDEIITLFSTCSAAHEAMLRAVRRTVG